MLDDPNGYAVSNAYGLTNVPTLFLIGQDGQIEISSVGWVKQDIEEINRKLAAAQQTPPLAILIQGKTSATSGLVEGPKTDPAVAGQILDKPVTTRRLTKPDEKDPIAIAIEARCLLRYYPRRILIRGSFRYNLKITFQL